MTAVVKFCLWLGCGANVATLFWQGADFRQARDRFYGTTTCDRVPQLEKALH